MCGEKQERYPGRLGKASEPGPVHLLSRVLLPFVASDGSCSPVACVLRLLPDEVGLGAGDLQTLERRLLQLYAGTLDMSGPDAAT